MRLQFNGETLQCELVRIIETPVYSEDGKTLLYTLCSIELVEG